MKFICDCGNWFQVHEQQFNKFPDDKWDRCLACQKTMRVVK